MSQHFAGPQSDEPATAALQALRAFTEDTSDALAGALYRELTQHAASDYVDPLIERVARDGNIRLERVLVVARWLAVNAADREPVKAAIALIGALSNGGDRELLMALGRHDEFTLFAATALRSCEPDGELALWELAQSVHGWGRVHTIQRLAGTEHPGIKAWLLREGYRSGALLMYTALNCAQTGDLVTALREPYPDEPLMKGAGAILAELVSDETGWFPILGYDGGVEVTQRYLAHVAGRPADLGALHTVGRIAAFLDAPPSDDELVDPRWLRSLPALKDLIRVITTRPDWPARILQGLDSDDPDEFWHALRAAPGYGIDPWERCMERVQAGQDYWHDVAATDDPARAARVVLLAEKKLLHAEPTLGLVTVLQMLERFPGTGWPLIRARLLAPIAVSSSFFPAMTRNMAVRALAAWSREQWPTDAFGVLWRALDAEPEGSLRDSIVALMRGRSSGS